MCHPGGSSRCAVGVARLAGVGAAAVTAPLRLTIATALITASVYGCSAIKPGDPESLVAELKVVCDGCDECEIWLVRDQREEQKAASITLDPTKLKK